MVRAVRAEPRSPRGPASTTRLRGQLVSRLRWQLVAWVVLPGHAAGTVIVLIRRRSRKVADPVRVAVGRRVICCPATRAARAATAATPGVVVAGVAAQVAAQVPPLVPADTARPECSSP